MSINRSSAVCLNYGDITIHGTGERLEPLRGIGAPLDFRNHVTAR